MNKFPLFFKSDKPYPSVKKKIYLTLFICFGILFFRQEFFLLEKNFIDYAFITIIVFILFYAAYYKISEFMQVEPLGGILDGHLIFENEYIQANDEIFHMEEIRKMKISNNDYEGKLINITGTFGPNISNGINNYIILFLESGKNKKFQFQMSDSNNLQDIRTILIGYYLKKKIDFWEIANVLGEKSTSEIANFTKEIEQISTAANTC